MLKKPKPREIITYSGFVMHNCSFIGFKCKEFTVVRPEPGTIAKDTIWLSWTDGNGIHWEGWIPTGAYKHQIAPYKEGFLDDEQEALYHPAWRKALPSNVE